MAPLLLAVLLALVSSCGRRATDPGSPECLVFPSLVQFGWVRGGDSTEAGFKVKNMGAGVLEVTPQLDCADFRIVSGGGRNEIRGGDSLLVRVRYTATAAGPNWCTVTLEGTDCEQVSCLGNPFRTWHVRVDGSGDAPSVQAAIDSAASGDSVLVGPGRYYENIDYLGKEITVKSEEGPEATILDGSRRDSSVVVITHHETRKAVLEGFTVTGGTGSRFKTNHRQYGGGILCLGASPTIRGNWIVDNQGFEAGGIGIGPDVDMVPPAPLVEGNLIARNYAPLDGGGWRSVTVTLRSGATSSTPIRPMRMERGFGTGPQREIRSLRVISS